MTGGGSLAHFDTFYRGFGFIRAGDGPVAAWGHSTASMTHGSVSGAGHGPRPSAVRNFVALRGDSERRNAWLKWRAEPAATGYVIRCGVAPDKLYTSVMVYGANEYYFNAMDRDRIYYFQIEAFNEAGISDRSDVVTAQ